MQIKSNSRYNCAIRKINSFGAIELCVCVLSCGKNPNLNTKNHHHHRHQMEFSPVQYTFNPRLSLQHLKECITKNEYSTVHPLAKLRSAMLFSIAQMNRVHQLFFELNTEARQNWWWGRLWMGTDGQINEWLTDWLARPSHSLAHPLTV